MGAEREMGFDEYLPSCLEKYGDLFGNNPWHRQMLEYGRRENEIELLRLEILAESVSISYDVNVLASIDIKTAVVRLVEQAAKVDAGNIARAHL